MVPQSLQTWFEEKLVELGVEKDVYIEDVFEYISTKEETSESISRNVDNTTFSFNDYYRYNQILDYVKSLEATYENSSSINLRVIEGGTTSEGRPLMYIKLSNRTEDTKPIIIVEAGINPREWITVPSSLNIVTKLLDGGSNRLLSGFEWIIIPVLNPDGYEYTHTNLRLWTKSRSTQSNLGAICPGVNINRNFNIDWLAFDSSSSPCSHLYGGIMAFSEVESRLIQSLLEEYGSRIRMYISLQNNGGFISYPWQYERAASGMFVQHHILGMRMIDAMEENYDLGIASIAYGDRASGTSADYMRNAGILYTFNIDVAPRGESGVIVPREEIPRITEDVWRAVSTAANSIL
ncbi:carboxypeptidase B-like [Battus philenor]|uniref:carboxypeptidase B-like n=1 Tax=Battus philenor TaxID=42288 RepID=UPI0035D0163E